MTINNSSSPYTYIYKRAHHVQTLFFFLYNNVYNHIAYMVHHKSTEVSFSFTKHTSTAAATNFSLTFTHVNSLQKFRRQKMSIIMQSKVMLLSYIRIRNKIKKRIQIHSAERELELKRKWEHKCK